MPFRPLNNTSQPTSQQNSDGFRILADPNGNPTNQNQDFQMESLQPTPQQPQDGFLKGLAKGIARPFLEVGATINNTGNAVGSLVKGGFSQEAANQAARNLNTSYNLPFFGETKPAFTGEESLGESLKKQAGYGAEFSSYIIPVGKAATLGKSAIKPAAGQILKNTAKTSGQFALAGALGDTGRQLQEKDLKDYSLEQTVGAAAIGAAIPLTLGSARLAGRGVGNFASGVKNTIWPNVEAAFTKAIKPRSNNFRFAQSLKTALPDLAEVAQNRGGVESLEHLDDVLKQSKNNIWSQYEGILGPNANAQIDGNQVADTMISTLDKRFIQQNPTQAKAIIEKANTYRRPLTLQEAEDFLQSSNGELNSYYAKNKVKQNVAMRDPEVAHVVKEAEALREALYSKLDELTGADAAALKKRYSALENIQSEVAQRKNVTARANPENLAEQMSYGRAIGNIAKSAANFQLGDALSGGADLISTRVLKDRNTSDNLIKLAFNKLLKRNVTPYPKVAPKPFVPAGLLSAPSYMPMPEKTVSTIQREIMSSGILPQPNIQPSSSVVPEATWLNIQNQFNQSPQKLLTPQPNILQLPTPRALSKVKKNPIGDTKTIPLSQRAAMLKQFLELR